MCIRDSPHIVRLIGRMLRSLIPELHALEAFGGAEGLTIAPVSYTHLRAHETVLDLVCRLLLEKKKQRASITHLTEHNTQHG